MQDGLIQVDYRFIASPTRPEPVNCDLRFCCHIRTPIYYAKVSGKRRTIPI
jgi:hypothetical protein